MDAGTVVPCEANLSPRNRLLDHWDLQKLVFMSLLSVRMTRNEEGYLENPSQCGVDDEKKGKTLTKPAVIFHSLFKFCSRTEGRHSQKKSEGLSSL